MVSPKLGPGLSVWSGNPFCGVENYGWSQCGHQVGGQEQIGTVLEVWCLCVLLVASCLHAQTSYKDQKTVGFLDINEHGIWPLLKFHFLGTPHFQTFQPNIRLLIIHPNPIEFRIDIHTVLWGYDWYHILYPNPINIHIIDPLIPFIWSHWFHQYSHEIDSTCSSDRQI